MNLEKMKQYPTWPKDWQILSVLSVFNGLLLFYLSGRKVPALPGEVRPEAPESLKFGCPEKLRAEVDPLPCQPGPTGFRRSQRYLRVQLRAQLPAGGCGYGTSVRQQRRLLPRTSALHPRLHRGLETSGRDSAGGCLGGSRGHAAAGGCAVGPGAGHAEDARLRTATAADSGGSAAGSEGTTVQVYHRMAQRTGSERCALCSFC